MEPREYIPVFLEHEYLKTHDGLTPAALELVHEEIARNPAQFAADDHARALVSYARTHEHLMRELDRMEDLPDDDFDRQRERLFNETRQAMHEIARTDQLCVDAQLVDILLADVPIDSCLNDLMKLEDAVRTHLCNVPGFDLEAEHYWRESELDGMDAAERTRIDPIMIGWLHTLEAIAQLSLASARYRAAADYARRVMRSQGYDNRAIGTVLLALARLEDEEHFFELSHEAGPEHTIEDSPWYLLGRTLLFYKLGRRKNARRALRDFATRCEGGAFFLLNPTYLTPYLPVRPAPRDPWDLSHQAVWEADGIIVDTPDFVTWAASVDGIEEASEQFAQRYGF
ncbi:hypothetical protein B5F74_07270 [Collinsella sp. An271]|uniref:hypothetical protein n=1 Tax=Collinsella sp. An271 TaxID=1965616 RepID=UPI000B364C19|nr:hypothetical protein [Collinsella sp. An271]OUO60002.1 hypothetical protein B5F74_07270 [Collinsella sp. An271]